MRRKKSLRLKHTSYPGLIPQWVIYTLAAVGFFSIVIGAICFSASKTGS